jgi:hypothetical protein
MKSLLLIVIALVGTACVNPKGQVTINYPTQFERKTIFGNTKTFTIQPGIYSAKLKMTSKNKAKLKISGVKHPVSFKVPGSIDQNGETVFLAHELGQPFNVKILVDTELSEGPEQRTTEDCTVTIRTNVCEIVDGHRTCHLVTKEVDGKKRVIFKMDYTDRDVEVTMWNPATHMVHLSFKGHDRDSKKRVLHSSQCHPVVRRMVKKIPFGDPFGDSDPLGFGF